MIPYRNPENPNESSSVFTDNREANSGQELFIADYNSDPYDFNETSPFYGTTDGIDMDISYDEDEFREIEGMEELNEFDEYDDLDDLEDLDDFDESDDSDERWESEQYEDMNRYYGNFAPCWGDFRNFNQGNPRQYPCIAPIIFELEDDDDEYSRSPLAEEVKDTLSRIENDNQEVFNLLALYNVPYPVAKKVVRRVSRLTLTYNK